MVRRIFTIASAVSLLLCVVTAVLWVRSYSGFDSLVYTDDRHLENARRCELFSNAGLIGACSFTYDGGMGHFPGEPLVESEPGRRWSFMRSPVKPYDFVLGLVRARQEGEYFLGFGGYCDPHPDATAIAFIPDWFLVLVTLVLPGWQIWIVFRSDRRLKLRRCLSCGYDLRATPDRCPECGHVPDSTKATA